MRQPGLAKKLWGCGCGLFLLLFGVFRLIVGVIVLIAAIGG